MSRKSSEILLKALQNPTKFNVIAILSDEVPMTVTQMAKAVKVSRANLYHFVSEMVEEGLLLGPESKVKGNYVEKYYRLNKRLFNQSEEEWKATVKAATPNALRDLMYSFLISVSTQFRIMAEGLAIADDEKLARLADGRKRQQVIGSYGVLPDEEYAAIVNELGEVLTAHERRVQKTASAPGKNKLVIFAMPDLSSKQPD